MYEARNTDNDLANRIVKSNIDRMFAGVLAGNNVGRVWVDNPVNPASAIVWSDGLECFQFMGCETNQVFNKELNAFIHNALTSFLKEKGLDFFEFAADEEKWYTSVFNALPDKEIKKSWQYVYKSGPDAKGNSNVTIPRPYSLQKIDQNFIYSVSNGVKVSNPEFLMNYLEQYWGSADNYLNHGYGYAAVDGEKIVSFGITSFLYKETFTIGVETLEQHRRKGLAGILVNILLKELYSKGYDIWWDCTESNIASQKTAESAGLVFDHKYEVCWFHF